MPAWLRMKISLRPCAAEPRVGRRGAVLDGRYHHRALGTPREVRAALAYVLLNARKHAARPVTASEASEVRVDPASSGRWFGGWADREAAPPDAPGVPVPAAARVVAARSCSGAAAAMKRSS
jgi:hypothetical protein